MEDIKHSNSNKNEMEKIKLKYIADKEYIHTHIHKMGKETKNPKVQPE